MDLYLGWSFQAPRQGAHGYIEPSGISALGCSFLEEETHLHMVCLLS